MRRAAKSCTSPVPIARATSGKPSDGMRWNRFEALDIDDREVRGAAKQTELVRGMLSHPGGEVDSEHVRRIVFFTLALFGRHLADRGVVVHD